MDKPYIMIWFTDDVIWQVRFERLRITRSELIVYWNYDGISRKKRIPLDAISHYTVQY